MQDIHSQQSQVGSFNKLFDHISDEMRDLLRGLLEFNPYFRLSAKEALNSNVFDCIRCPHFETPCKIKMKMKYQREGTFDYEANTSLKY